MILQKIALTLVVVILLVMSLHRSVAAAVRPLEADLSLLPSLVAGEKRTFAFTCENLPQQLREFRDYLIAEGDRLADYLEAGAQYYLDWRHQLSQFESSSVLWRSGMFLPLSESADNLDISSDVVYELVSRDEEVAEKIQVALDTCQPAGADLEDVAGVFQKFLLMNSEHLSAVADFLSQMRPRLKEKALVWQGMEGVEVDVPAEFFADLAMDSKIFSEGSGLVRENSGFVRQQYEDFLNLLLGNGASKVDFGACATGAVSLN